MKILEVRLDETGFLGTDIERVPRGLLHCSAIKKRFWIPGWDFKDLFDDQQKAILLLMQAADLPVAQMAKDLRCSVAYIYKRLRGIEQQTNTPEIMYYYSHGFPAKDIAVILQLNYNTVWRAIQRHKNKKAQHVK